MTITIENLVSREVHYCVSGIVSRMGDLMDEAATELCYATDDWEEAAIQAGAKERAIGGWRFDDGRDGVYATAQELCEANDIEPYQREVYEHWAVSDWLADKLAEKGEKVDKDFHGMTVWARTTTGQGIASDSVIETIYAELTKGA